MSILGKRTGRPLSRIQFDIILKRFLIYLKRELQITYDIPVVLMDDADFSKRVKAFGYISDKNVVYLSIINRHPVDILRTLAHEYVHYKQLMERGIPKVNKPGTPIENQANAKAGEIVRKYAELNPELFDYMSVR